MTQLYCNSPNWDMYECADYGYPHIYRNIPLYGYKAFNNDMKCLSFQYEVGKTYTIPKEELEMCRRGFHFCRYPLDVKNYYDDFFYSKKFKKN